MMPLTFCGAYKTVVILKYFSEMTIREIACAMDIPEGTVKAYLNRARTKLRGHLKEGYFMQLKFDDIPVSSHLEDTVSSSMDTIRKNRRKNRMKKISSAVPPPRRLLWSQPYFVSQIRLLPPSFPLSAESSLIWRMTLPIPAIILTGLRY